MGVRTRIVCVWGRGKRERGLVWVGGIFGILRDGYLLVEFYCRQVPLLELTEPGGVAFGF